MEWIGGAWINSARFSATLQTDMAILAQQRRRKPAEDRSDGLAEVLQDADFDIVVDFGLTAQPGAAPLRRGVTTEADEFDITVPVADNESAVLLVETIDGVLHWQRPIARDPATGTRRAVPLVDSSRAGLVHFAFGDTSGAAPLHRGPVTDWLIDKLVDPVRTIVLRFVVSHSIDAAVARIEGGNPAGPVTIAGGDPRAWVPGGSLAAPESWTNKRILLMVHGTFSSTAGSFGGLATTQEGRDFLSAAGHHYDLVLGHDHRTLAEDPVTNAEALLATLTALRPPPGTIIDAVAYSRGGLVFRSLAEQLLPASGLDVTIGKAVFVGCTNGGTHLAEPLNWQALVDCYTNILLAAGHGGLVLAGGGALDPLVTFAIKTLGRFVQMFSEVAISDRRVPGLAAMEPGSQLVTSLNGKQASLGSAVYHAVTSSFEPKGGTGSLPAKVTAFLTDRITDRLFQAPNDFVVDTASMTDFGMQTDRLQDGLAFGDTAEVWHTSYFASPTVARELARRLLPQLQQQQQKLPEPDLASPSPSPPAAAPEAPVWHGRGLAGMAESFDLGLETASEIDTSIFRGSPTGTDIASTSAPPTRRSPRPSGAEPSASLAPPPTVDRFLAAEMLPYPEIERDARVYVTLSANQIAITTGVTAAATATPVPLQTQSPLEIELIPNRNCQLVGPAILRVDATEEQTIAFIVRGIAPGAAELTIVARQDDHVVATFVLKPTFISTAAAPLSVRQDISPPDDSAENLAIMRIYETVEPNGALSLRFELVSEDPRIALREDCKLDPRFNLGAYVGDVLNDVEAAWNMAKTPGLYASALSRFAAAAKNRAAAIIPATIRATLWEHQDNIGAIQVISDVPFIPWELMALTPPPGSPPRPGKSKQFLSEWGLVRWLPGVPLPRGTIGLRGDRSHYVIPTYYKAGNNLPGAMEEKAMLEAVLPGIQPVEASATKVEEFLGSGALDGDILHFACHGLAEQKAVLDSYLLMAGFPGTMVDDPLTIDQVKAAACFAPKNPRSLVFLNACQTGREGEGIAGVAGFADAFIRPLSGRGAAAFVGALWSVTDSLAQTFAQTFYERLKQGDTLVAATKAAREASDNGDDFTWLAYTVYGNPFARSSTQ